MPQDRVTGELEQPVGSAPAAGFVRRVGPPFLVAALIIVVGAVALLWVIPKLYQGRTLARYTEAFRQLPHPEGTEEVTGAAFIAQSRSVWVLYTVGELRRTSLEPGEVEAFYAAPDFEEAFNQAFEVDPTRGNWRGGVRRMSIAVRFFEDGSCTARMDPCPTTLQVTTELPAETIEAMSCAEALCLWDAAPETAAGSLYAVVFTQTGGTFWEHQLPMAWKR